MSEVKYATRYRATYETFEAHCPCCEHLNVFNRASDLGDLQAISFKQVACENAACGQVFAINRDLVNPPHELLLYDCAELIERKRYAYAVLNAAQAFEVFFSLYLRVELAYKPFAREPERISIELLNSTLEALYQATERHTYIPLRNIFLRLLVNNTAPSSLAEARNIIASLEKKRADVPEAEIRAYPNAALRDLLLKLNACTINRARNKVVHKDAYRPTLQEATQVVDEAKGILLPLGVHLFLFGDDANWHFKRA